MFRPHTIATGGFTLFFSLLGVQASLAASLLSPSDLIIAVDTVAVAGNSSSPSNEFALLLANPPNTETKYLNRGGAGSGFIVIPSGSTLVEKVRFTTANDAPERDPSSWELYGTNAEITSGNHSSGTAESWTLIAGGALNLPDTRNSIGSQISFSNTTAYSSYKMVFPTLKNRDYMHIADVEIFTDSGVDLVNFDSVILAIDAPATNSWYPSEESPARLIDGNASTKYLNHGEEFSGVIVRPSVGLSVIDGFELTTAGDAPERDPTSYKIYGTNAELMSLDNSLGDLEPWSLISEGYLSLPDERGVAGGLVSFSNSTPYSLYRIVFPEVKDSGAADSMQLGEMQFYGTVVPEPRAALLALTGLIAVLLPRRRRLQ